MTVPFYDAALPNPCSFQYNALGVLNFGDQRFALTCADHFVISSQIMITVDARNKKESRKTQLLVINALRNPTLILCTGCRLVSVP